MYYVAICDDDKTFILYIEKIIKRVIYKETFQIKFYEYSSGEELINSINSSIRYDLLILDMQLGGMDGDDTARLFRERFPDAVLVFCSGVQFPTVKSFKATPFRYLLKSYSDSEFANEIKEIMDRVKKQSDDIYIVGHYRNNTVKVKIRNILYIENAKRGSRIIVDPECAEAAFEGVILVDEKLSEISKKFTQLVFAHNSYIVNINRVEYVNGMEMVLDTGEKLTVSRLYKKTFRETFTKSIAGKY